MNRKTFLFSLCALTLMQNGAVLADSDQILLTVTSAEKTETFTLQALQDLPVSHIETSTIWTEGVQEFVGVLLADLLAHLDMPALEIKAFAINDYAVQIPVQDATQDGPLIAYLQNDAVMQRRDKGPLWIVYPYDSFAKYQTEMIYGRSIWQLDRMDISN